MVSLISCIFLLYTPAFLRCSCGSVFTACVKGNSVNVKRVWYPCNVSGTFLQNKTSSCEVAEENRSGRQSAADRRHSATVALLANVVEILAFVWETGKQTDG
jgi:hypothetical protein